MVLIVMERIETETMTRQKSRRKLELERLDQSLAIPRARELFPSFQQGRNIAYFWDSRGESGGDEF